MLRELPRRFSSLDFVGGERKGSYSLRKVLTEQQSVEMVGSDWLFWSHDFLLSARGDLFTFAEGSSMLAMVFSRGYGNLHVVDFDIFDLVRAGVKAGEVSSNNLEVIEAWQQRGVFDARVVVIVLDGPKILVSGRTESVKASELGSLPGRPTYSWGKDSGGGFNGKVGVEIYVDKVVVYFETLDGRVAYQVRREVSEIPRFDRKLRDHWPIKAGLRALKEAIFI